MFNTFASTIQTYNKFASQFAQHLEKKRDENELNTFLELVTKGGNILDAGCGTARDSAYFISKGYIAMGIDLSEGLLAEAKALHPEVPTQLMSLTEITFPDHVFDGIWCKAALLHIDRSDIPKVLNTFFRILKPGGLLFIQTKEGEGQAAQPVPFDDSLTRLFTFFTIAEMENLVKEAGFTLIKSYSFNRKSRVPTAADMQWIVLFTRK